MESHGAAPRFLAYPRAFTAQSGSDAMLRCQIAGDPRPSVLWEKDTAPIQPTGRYCMEAKGDVYSLRVSCVTPQDGGLYVCKAKNCIGETYAAATLRVEAGEHQQEEEEEGHAGSRAPTFLVGPSSVRVCRGEDVTFSCRVLGQPCPLLEWEKDGCKLCDLFESSHFAVGQQPEDWHYLKLFGVRPPDAGVYVCRARSGSKEALAAAVLLVEPWCSPSDSTQPWQQRHGSTDTWAPAPNGTPRAKAFAVSAGKHAKFRCYVTGKPKPEIVWQKDGKVVAPGRRHLVYEDREGYFILKVLYCRPRDQGLYVCTASNTAGQTLSAVQLQVKEHRLRFQVPLEDVEVAEREDAVLECQVPLGSIPTSWFLEDRELQPSHKYVMEECGVVRRLTIRDARTDDDGVYLCQMKDRGRSVAEVSVRGLIVKRLPRKLDVMEGENAAFCVETREAMEGICWSRNGLQLHESPRAVLKSFGRTHLLVLVHVTREDAGIICFSAGESLTSSQLRVKCVKRDPPSAPMAAQMSTEQSNAALLTWCPAPDVHHRPPSTYILERREVAGSSWVQCLSTELPGRVQVLGDSVPREADYCFRVCAVNKHGRSDPVEFPGCVHLVPAVRLERGLQDARVRDGEDARFSVELSASVQGEWFLNCTRLQSKESRRFSVQHCGTEHSLIIRSARLRESGTHVTFVASSVRDSARLHVQAPQAHIAPVPEARRLRELLAGLPLLLECEVSPAGAPVQWLKDGEAVVPSETLSIQSEGCWRRLHIPTAVPSDSGTYTCDAGDDTVSFVVTVSEAPVRIVSSNEETPHTYVAGQRVELWCQLSRAEAPVHWYKDGEEVEEGESLVLEREGPRCCLVLPCARLQDAGEFVCDVGGDSVFYTITVAEPPVRIVSSNEAAPHTYVAGQRVELWCQLSRAEASVHWYKDGEEVEEGESLVLEREGPQCCLVLPCARPQDAGEFVCDVGGDSVFYTIVVAAPQAHIAPVPEAQQLRELLAGLPLLLECEVSPAGAPVQWLKDGEAVVPSETLSIQSEGCWRRLHIPTAVPSDSGTYTCDAGDDTVSFVVTVSEAPVRIVSSNEETPHTYEAGQRVELWCQLSRAEAPVHWYKDGEEVEEGESLVLEREGQRCCLVLPCARLQDAGEFVCDTGDTAASYHVMVAEPRVRILHPVQRSLELPVLAPGHVELRCELSVPDAAVRWFKDGLEVDETNNLRLLADGAWRCLLIPRSSAEDTGEYICESKDEAVSFDVKVTEPPVKILQPQRPPPVVKVSPGETVMLSCELSRADAPVCWAREGVQLEAGGSWVLEEDGAHRRLLIPAAQAEHAGKYFCDAADDVVTFTVQVSDPPIRILEKDALPTCRRCRAMEDLVLEVQLSHTHGEVKWYKDGEKLQDTGHVRLEEDGQRRALVILGATDGDAGEYLCDTRDDSVIFCVTVEAQAVRIVNKEEAQSPLEVQEGDSVTLVAQLSPETAVTQWQKDGQMLLSGGRLLVCSEGPARSLTIKQVELGDAGTFLCDAGDDEVYFTLHVKEAPVLFVNKQEEREKLLVLEGGSAVLSAVVSKERADITWLCPQQLMVPSERCQLRCDGRVHSLVLSNVAKEDAGVYTCLSPDDQMQFDISVRELQVKFLRGLSDVRAQQGETVVLWCELCKARGDVVWLKDGRVLEPDARREVRVQGRERSLVLSCVRPEDAGEYCCESNNDRTLATLTVQVRRVVEIIVELQSLMVLEGDDATFKCMVSPEDVAVTWQLDGQPVVPSERLQVARSGLCHSLTVRGCQPGDAATVTANAEGLLSTARLSVQEAQVLFVQKLRDMVAEEQQDVCLEVEVSHEAAEVQWLKQGVLLQPSDKYLMCESGCRRTLTICCVSPSDRGTYRCESLHDRTQAKLSVEPQKVSIRRPLADVEIFEKQTATFLLELSHAGVPGVWTRGGVRVKPSATCRVSATGCTHSLTLEGLALEDSGTITFTADTLHCSARLLVREPPISMVKLLQDLEVPEAGTATFECELSRPSAEVKWLKDGMELRPGPHCRMYSAGRRRLLQLNRCALPDAGIYTCEAGDCQASATLRVHEHQVHIMQELQDACVQEGDNAVFMCEVSHGDVLGEWFRDGEKIKVSSTVKIRQEGTRHFLLLCTVRPEDAGAIRFAARMASSEASLKVEVLPIRIVKPLRDKTVLARHKATLECIVSHARGRVRWLRGDTEIFASDKYEICNLDCYRTLIIHCVGREDEDSYTCDAFDDRSTARLLVEGS
ncbi:obscurin-like protein 1 isoform X6 [Tympanuchus pallidicinctus]|uniref:obscurin-like protein 1 isoform X6 n=1 Tax=Tympanuchus pallidicinctus TaxID=109042 RepID=UPI0022870FF8|nr:obscurin-like protein 1 isoform X6 [Tympanuchus pallidicinctus]